MATISFGPGQSFTWSILEQSDEPPIMVLRGEFYEGGVMIGTALETSGQSVEDAASDITCYAHVLAPAIFTP